MNGKDNEVRIEYDRAKFVSLVAELLFDKAIEIHKFFIVE